MCICGKIFITNLHNLQILYMLQIKYKFSECQAPLHKHEAPNGRLSGEGPSQVRRHGAQVFGGSAPHPFFTLPKFCCAQKKFS